MSDVRRIPGWIVASVLVGVIALTLAFAMFRWWTTRWPSGPVLGLVAVDASHAIVVRSSDPKEGWVDVVALDANEGPKWRETLFGLQHVDSPRGVPGGVSAFGGLVTVRVLDDDQTLETHAFRSVDGTFAWRGGKLPRAPQARVQGDLPTVLADHVQYEPYTQAAGGVVLGLDRATGKERFRIARPKDETWARVWAAGGRLVVALRDGGALGLAPDGERKELVAPGRPTCGAGDAVLWLDPEGALHAVSAKDGSDRTLLSHLGAALAPPLDAPTLRACGTRHGAFVLVVTAAGSGDHVVGLSPDGASVAWQVPVPGRASNERARATVVLPPDGALPRILPLVEPAQRLVAVDLDAHRLRFDNPADEVTRVVSADHDWLVERDRGRLTRLDGTSGALSGVVIGDGTHAVVPDERGGTVWVSDGTHVAPLSLATLRPLRSPCPVAVRPLPSSRALGR